MRLARQKFILILIPVIYMVIFWALRECYRQDVIAVQNSVFPVANLGFIILSDALLTILLLFIDSHIWANAAGGVCFVMSVALYSSFNAKFGLFCNPSALICSMLMSYAAAYLVKFTLSKSNKRLVNAILGAYFSKKTRNQIISGLAACEPVKKNITIMECSIYALDRLMQENNPKTLFSKINFTLETVITKIIENSGRVDKFVGAKIYAYWDGDDVSHLAVKAALEACKLLDLAGTDIKIHIGIHYDEAILGILGTPKVMNYSIITPAMEAMDMIVAACALYDKRILISKEVYKHGWRQISAIKTAAVNLRGSIIGTDLYEPLEVKNKENRTPG